MFVHPTRSVIAFSPQNWAKLAIRDTFWGYKHQKTENLLKTCEDKVLKNEASEKNLTT